jgi:hypothetical protein
MPPNGFPAPALGTELKPATGKFVAAKAKKDPGICAGVLSYASTTEILAK